jgi:hypothetical protein
MHELIESLGRVPGARIEAAPSHWTIRVSKPRNVELEILVPRDVLEWFITARDASGAEVWSDWVDYTGYVPKREENLDQLASDMRRDVEEFVKRLVAADDFRVTTKADRISFGRFRSNLDEAEWRIDGQWQPVWPLGAE